ncbi:hypothetical protein ACFL0V_04795 [Nanoarchaeota archaeon]
MIWNKKGDVFGIPIHYLIIFVVMLLVIVLIIVAISGKSGGLLSRIFDAIRGTG